MKKLHISKGNTKLGAIPSISFPPIVTCRANVPCKKKCYACKSYRQYPAVRTAYNDNLELYADDIVEFYGEATRAISKLKSPLFRWLVSGDAPTSELFGVMHWTAWDNPAKRFLAYTKRHDWLKAYLNVVGDTPDNLVIRQSLWGVGERSLIDVHSNIRYALTVLKGERGQDISLSGDIVVRCHGNCRTCNACWDRDVKLVLFEEH